MRHGEECHAAKTSGDDKELALWMSRWRPHLGMRRCERN